MVTGLAPDNRVELDKEKAIYVRDESVTIQKNRGKRYLSRRGKFESARSVEKEHTISPINLYCCVAHKGGQEWGGQCESRGGRGEFSTHLKKKGALTKSNRSIRLIFHPLFF